MTDKTNHNRAAIEALGAEKPMGRDSKALRILRDSFIGRLPEDQRVASVKLAWQEFWNKASLYLGKEALSRLGEALVVASTAHSGQFRSSGEPYIIHVIHVAIILADMEIDIDTLTAALLHDVLEDTSLSAETLRERFGSEVVTLVDGVTKLGKLPFKSLEDYQAENLRKMFLVMAKDIRVVLIKLADRLHNMRTLQALRRDKQLRIARETLEIYAPLAHRLGIYQIKRDLEDLCFKILDPDMFYEMRRRVRKKLPEREAIIKRAIDELSGRLKDAGIDSFITGRAKHFYSIYEKMQRKNLSLDQLYDLLALRVIVNNLTECYTVLGLVHTIWKPIPGQFDDYIANPKNNMYQSLHTTVVGPSGEPLEVQIRTWEMHWLAEYGIAAHWRYKERPKKLDDLDAKLSWIRQVLETQSESSEPGEFLEQLKADVLSTEVFVFTPKGDVRSLPKGSVPIDFAYEVHTEVGHKCVGAMINGRIVPMDHELQNGDIVRILTSPQGKPSRDWLKLARSGRARAKIRAYFRQIERAEREARLERGRELLLREVQRRDSQIQSLEPLMSGINYIARDLGYASGEELIIAMGGGSHAPAGVAARLWEQKTPAQALQEPLPVVAPKKESDSEIVVEGADGVLVSLANCCLPVPGDSIVGFVTKSRGITVHRADCPNVTGSSSDRTVEVSWGRKRSERYTARLRLEAMDRPGLFADVSQVLCNLDASMVAVKANVVGAQRARMTIDLSVKDVEHLYRVMARLNALDNVIEVIRG